MKIISLVLLIIFLSGCSKNNNSNITGPENPTLNYAQGEVSFGLKDSVSLEEVANYIYSFNNISIGEIVFFQYYSNFPHDSIQSIKSSLESKNYINSETLTITYDNNESRIVVKFWIKNFRKDDIKNWELLKTQFHLVHLPNEYQSGLLIIPIGKEKEWVNILSNSNLFRFVELNYITHTS